MEVQVKKIKTFTVWLTIAVLGLLTLNNSIFLHVHKLESGIIISHAHPFNKSANSNDETNHNHTSNEIYVYQILSHIDFVLLVFFAYRIFVLLHKTLRNKFKQTFLSVLESDIFRIRPPPVPA